MTGYDTQGNGEEFAGPGFDRTVSERSIPLSLEPIAMTFRVLGPHERGRFAPEAWGHLLSLNGAGVLNAAELEHVIERAMTQIDGRIALDDLRSLMEGAGFDEDGGSDHTTVH